MHLIKFLPLLLLAACGKVQDPSIQIQHDATLSAPQLRETTLNPSRNLYWGDTHVHTSLSFDALTFGVRTLPDDAYRYMKGETIEHGGGYTIRAKRPLDFGVVTDHAEYMGIARHLARDKLQENSFTDAVQSGNPLKVTWEFIWTNLTTMSSGDKRDKAFNRPELKPVSIAAWQQIIAAAEHHNRPGRFTAFIGYEWSSMPEAQNLHRNVIYRSNKVPDFPFSSLDSKNPEDLWDALDQQRGVGMDNLAIPHNANLSNGLMYAETSFNGEPLDAAYAAQRLRNEPISEIMQVKGASETHPDLSPADGFADFGIYDQAMSVSGGQVQSKGGYMRDALLTGLKLQQANGFNPYRFGVIGASDGHNSSSPVEEDNYHGKLPVLDGSAGIRLGKTLLLPDSQNRGRQWFAMGLAAVWAEENTRESLFDAMRRGETYATSGPRIGLRFFAGRNLDSTDLNKPDALRRAYEHGVAMGGQIKNSADNKPPVFLVLAAKDPRGANLDRIQMVKGWVDGNGQSHEKIFNIAASDGRTTGTSGELTPVGNSVDVANASYRNSIGATQLQASWRDPDFNPEQQAFYYVRILEIPTPTSTTYDAKALGLEAPTPATHQERAISSAIWYIPQKEKPKT